MPEAEQRHSADTAAASTGDFAIAAPSGLETVDLGVDALLDQLRRLETQQEDFIQADIQHLRELAVLNRLAETLSQRRSYVQVLKDAVSEARRIAQPARVWIIEPDASGAIRNVHADTGPLQSAESLPQEVRDAFARIVQEQPLGPLSLPSYTPDLPEGVYTGMSLHSGKHVAGVLLMYFTDPRRANNSHQTRLLQTMLHQTGVACENARLFETMSRMIVDVVIAMALAIESRDPYTGGHVLRVTAYGLMLGQTVGLDTQSLDVLRLGGLLHDIGKVAVPDAILRKPGRLTTDEFEVMQSHAPVGDDIVRSVPQLTFARSVVRSHHERFDGQGYPDKLAGTDIPLLARIAAIADTFDAMTSDRPYRRGMEFSAALAEITRCSGTQFDPELASAFVDGPRERFDQAIDAMVQWRRADHRADSLGLIELLELDLPQVRRGLQTNDKVVV